MHVTGEHLWSLLPSKSACFDNQCLSLFNNETVTVHPQQITEIDAGIRIDTTSGHVLQVQHHTCDKPWRILVDYLYPDPATKTVTIPIITKRTCVIPFGDTLCHVKEIPLDHAYTAIKGTIIIHLNLLPYNIPYLVIH